MTTEGPVASSKGAHHVGSVKVPDTRLERLRDLFKPKRFIPAEVAFTDVALPSGGQSGKGYGELTSFLSEADAFALVVQVFDEFDREGKPLDPAGQLESVLLDLNLSDLERIETRLERIAHEQKRGIRENEPERVLLERCKEALEAEKPLRSLDFVPDELKRLSSFRFLTQKRLFVVANVAEDRLKDDELGGLKAAAERNGLELMTFCAPLEKEIAALPPEEQAAFLADYGLGEPARIRVIQEAYRVLDLISFFTVGPDEVRAWTIRGGTLAQQAAGKIHSDIERGFIRAETVHCDDLIALGSHTACKEKALLRLEGKTYPVKDGDVIEFRFNA